jgi:hypothetical protein
VQLWVPAQLSLLMPTRLLLLLLACVMVLLLPHRLPLERCRHCGCRRRLLLLPLGLLPAPPP